MKYFKIIFLGIFSCVLIESCGSNNNGKEEKLSVTVMSTSDSLSDVPNNMIDDSMITYPGESSLPDSLKIIRDNFQRINAIPTWTKVRVEDLAGSTEGGEAKFYYQGKTLEKVMARYFGETFQLLTEYYLLDGQLSFVYEKEYRYNRPIYYDSAAMEESGDTEVFDIDKSFIHSTRSYFDKGKIVKQLTGNQKAGKNVDDPASVKESAKGQKIIMEAFLQLVELVSKK